MARRPRDFYPTPSWATRILLGRIPFDQHEHSVIEPCNGRGAIGDFLGEMVTTCDIDPMMAPEFVCDMSLWSSWVHLMNMNNGHRYDWVITNPPFNKAIDFARHGLESCNVGMALLLRLSFLEPVESRREWLIEHPPDHLIVLPRISFTGDGKTDSVTCAWMIWRRYVNYDERPAIEIVSRPH